MYKSFTKYLANNVCPPVVGIQETSALIKPNDRPDTRPTGGRRWLIGHFVLIYSCTLAATLKTQASGIQNTCRTTWQRTLTVATVGAGRCALNRPELALGRRRCRWRISSEFPIFFQWTSFGRCSQLGVLVAAIRQSQLAYRLLLQYAECADWTHARQPS